MDFYANFIHSISFSQVSRKFKCCIYAGTSLSDLFLVKAEKENKKTHETPNSDLFDSAVFSAFSAFSAVNIRRIVANNPM